MNPGALGPSSRGATRGAHENKVTLWHKIGPCLCISHGRRYTAVCYSMSTRKELTASFQSHKDSKNARTHGIWIESMEPYDEHLVCHTTRRAYAHNYIHSYVEPPSLASPFMLPLNAIFSSCPSCFASGFAALLAAKDCSKSAMISSMCSVPTEILIRSSVTPLSFFS